MIRSDILTTHFQTRTLNIVFVCSILGCTWLGGGPMANTTQGLSIRLRLNKPRCSCQSQQAGQRYWGEKIDLKESLQDRAKHNKSSVAKTQRDKSCSFHHVLLSVLRKRLSTVVFTVKIRHNIHTHAQNKDVSVGGALCTLCQYVF